MQLRPGRSRNDTLGLNLTFFFYSSPRLMSAFCKLYADFSTHFCRMHGIRHPIYCCIPIYVLHFEY